jgi:hypothetical protein
VIGTFGFLLPHKGTLELIEGIGLLRDQVPDVLLVGVCAIHPDPVSSAYREQCLAAIDRLDLHRNVTLVTDFLPDAEAQAVLSATDVVVLPYKETKESSSAALRFLLPLGRPIVASDIPIFADARDALIPVADPSPAGLAALLEKLLAGGDLAEHGERAAAFARVGQLADDRRPAPRALSRAHHPAELTGAWSCVSRSTPCPCSAPAPASACSRRRSSRACSSATTSSSGRGSPRCGAGGGPRGSRATCRACRCRPAHCGACGCARTAPRSRPGPDRWMSRTARTTSFRPPGGRRGS